MLSRRRPRAHFLRGIGCYEIRGKQYVATTSGVLSGFFGGSGTSAIIVFSLP